MVSPTRRGVFGGIAAAGLSHAWNPAALLVRGTPADAPAPPPFPPIDVDRIAQKIVAATRPSASDKAILIGDPAYFPELVPAIERELLKAGTHRFIALEFEAPSILEVLDELPDPGKRQDQYIELLAPLFREADLFFWLPTRDAAGDRRLEHLQDASRARGIHFHWVLGPAYTSPEDIAAASRMYERAVLETDYGALSRRQDRIVSALRGRALRVNTPDGTDLRMRVAADAWFHRNDGDMSPARSREARCVRDREMELPAGALRFIPDGSSTTGTLVVRRVPTRAGPAEGVTLEFEDGRVIRMHARSGEDNFRSLWKTFGGDIDRVGEIVIGTNPLLTEKLPSGDLPYAGYGEGYVRVSLGDNWESGGKYRCPLNLCLWLFLEDASVSADGTPVIQKGRLVVS